MIAHLDGAEVEEAEDARQVGPRRRVAALEVLADAVLVGADRHVPDVRVCCRHDLRRVRVSVISCHEMNAHLSNVASMYRLLVQGSVLRQHVRRSFRTGSGCPATSSQQF